MQPTGSGWPPFAGHETNTAGTSDGQDGEDEIATDRSHEIAKDGKAARQLEPAWTSTWLFFSIFSHDIS